MKQGSNKINFLDETKPDVLATKKLLLPMNSIAGIEVGTMEAWRAMMRGKTMGLDVYGLWVYGY